MEKRWCKQSQQAGGLEENLPDRNKARSQDELILQRLAQAEFFVGLDEKGLKRVLQAARRRRLERQEVCFRQDEPASFLYLLVAGKIKLTQLTPDGRQVLLRFVEPGEVFGGIALFAGEQYPVTAEAAEACELLLWDGPAMQRVIQSEPKVALNVIQHLAYLVKNLQDRVRELATERVEQRIARALIRLAAESGRDAPAVLHITRQDLGELTGTTLYTVSRTLSRWESLGWIESGRERITILDREALAALVDDSLPGGL